MRLPPDHSHNLNVRVPADLIKRLRLAAKREANGVSAVARRLLATALDEQQPSPQPPADTGHHRG
jgi:hypothetical protein